ncbi:MAG: AMP-binding protein [Rhodocyclaceae bacterium]|jgi:acyl-CoA synthetase (AMP-forming)/AMP-acid ligase II|nr:AMP-binding protein [Rhodocyclaceae bacterium]
MSPGVVVNNRHLAARSGLMAQWLSQGLHSGRPLGDEIRRGAEAWPETRVIFGSHERPWETTTGVLYQEALQCAAGLQESGFRQGDVIVLQVPNWHEGMVLFLAALHCGLVVVPVVHFYGAAELAFILGQTGARALAVPDRWGKINFAERVAGLGALPALEHIIVLGEGALGSRDLPWQSIMGRGASKDASVPGLDGSEICLINFTSGSTAAPKGALHSHQTIGAEVRNFTFPEARDGSAMMLWCGPAGHIGGVISWLRPFLCREGAVYLDQYDGALALALMDQHGVNLFGGAPYHGNQIFDQGEAQVLGGLKGFVVGGAGVPPQLVERAEALGIRAGRSYGSTEHPTITGSAPGASLAKRACTDGAPLPGNQVRIVDDGGEVLPVGSAGEIVSMGPELFLGYLDPVHNETAFTQDGWFRTGDIGVLDEEGYLTIVDRKKDIIIRGGENISSKEVEDLLARHPAVVEAAAVACPDPAYGERVAAVVRLRPGQTLDLEEVRAHFVAQGVAKQKTPEYLVVVDDLPRSPLGKVQKMTLRKEIVSLIESNPTATRQEGKP